MKSQRSLGIRLACFLFLVLAACDGVLPTPVAKLSQNPREYEGKTLLISGRVEDRSSLLVASYFTLKDDSGEIRVLTNRALPAVGEKVSVHGHVKQIFAMGSENLVVFSEDDLPAPK